VTDVWRASADEFEVVAGLLIEFRNHLGKPTPSDASFKGSAERLLADPDTEFWLARAAPGEPPAGICQLRFRHSVWTGVEDCWLEDLFVRAQARGQGLGRALVGRVLERATERGCARVELDTNEDNHQAIGLYEGLGFSAASKGSSRSLLYGVGTGVRS
jgi:ribosomal protein S18 acetylase RimI-like enzyme